MSSCISLWVYCSAAFSVRTQTPSPTQMRRANRRVTLSKMSGSASGPSTQKSGQQTTGLPELHGCLSLYINRKSMTISLIVCFWFDDRRLLHSSLLKPSSNLVAKIEWDCETENQRTVVNKIQMRSRIKIIRWQ